MGSGPLAFSRTGFLSWELWDIGKQKVSTSEVGYYKGPLEDLMLFLIQYQYFSA